MCRRIFDVETLISLQGITKDYGDLRALEDITLSISSGVTALILALPDISSFKKGVCSPRRARVRPTILRTTVLFIYFRFYPLDFTDN